MAMLMLLQPTTANVREILCRRFDIATLAERDRLEAGVAEKIVLRLTYHAIFLDPLLSRWSEESHNLRRLTHAALALHLVSRNGRHNGEWDFWNKTTFPIRQREAASEYVLGMPEDAISGFSALGPMAMQFWEVIWSGEVTFATPQDQLNAILAMPWQLQPTLVTELMQRLDAHTLSGFDIDAWSSQRAAQCIADGHFVAALRALLAPFVLACVHSRAGTDDATIDDAEEQVMRCLRAAQEVALARIPIAHSGPLIEALAMVVPVKERADDWPHEREVLALTRRFVSDPASFTVRPMEAPDLLAYFGAVWESVPDQASATLSRLVVFCERFNVLPYRRITLLHEINMAISEKAQQGEISKEDAARQIAELCALEERHVVSEW